MAHLHGNGTLAHVVWVAGAHTLRGGHVVIHLIGRLRLRLMATLSLGVPGCRLDRDFERTLSSSDQRKLAVHAAAADQQ